MSLTEEEFNRLRILALVRLQDELIEVGGGLVSTIVELIDGVRWIIVSHITEGELGRFKTEDLL